MELHVDMLTGHIDSHVQAVQGAIALHRAVVPAYQALCAKAATAGFELKLVSGFRNYEKQLKIWNEKAAGQRTCMDDNGEPVNIHMLTPEKAIRALMRWSAIPGASRHHWGTDFDLIASNLTPKEYHIQLSPKEIEPGAPFEAFNQWLEETLPSTDFFRPYNEDRGGVSPEWWHISFAPIAEQFFERYSLSLFEDTISDPNIALSSTLKQHSKSIYIKYVMNICNPD